MIPVNPIQHVRQALPTEDLGNDTEEYQKFVAEAAKDCTAEDAPCESCLSGGICDGLYS